MDFEPGLEGLLLEWKGGEGLLWLRSSLRAIFWRIWREEWSWTGSRVEERCRRDEDHCWLLSLLIAPDNVNGLQLVVLFTTCHSVTVSHPS